MELLSKEEACVLLKISWQTLQRWTKKGFVSVVRFGPSSIKYNKEVLLNEAKNIPRTTGKRGAAYTFTESNGRYVTPMPPQRIEIKPRYQRKNSPEAAISPEELDKIIREMNPDYKGGVL